MSAKQATGRIIPWLFHRDGNPIKDFRGVWASACKRAACQDEFRMTSGVRPSVIWRRGGAAQPQWAMVGHRTESIYRRYAIADEATLKEGAVKLAAFHPSEKNGVRKIVPIRKQTTK